MRCDDADILQHDTDKYVNQMHFLIWRNIIFKAYSRSDCSSIRTTKLLYRLFISLIVSYVTKGDRNGLGSAEGRSRSLVSFYLSEANQRVHISLKYWRMTVKRPLFSSRSGAFLAI
jgi:hypothetical protein